MRAIAVAMFGGAGGMAAASLASRPMAALLVALVSVSSLLVSAFAEQAACRSRERRERVLLAALATSLQTGKGLPYLPEALRALSSSLDNSASRPWRGNMGARQTPTPNSRRQQTRHPVRHRRDS